MTISRSKKYLAIAACMLATSPLLSKAVMPIYKPRHKRPDRTVVVTGACGNLGRAISMQLALRQARVIMACRDIDQCKAIRREIVVATNHKGIICRYLDLEDIDSINKFADDLIENEPHIDILINNAAVKDVKHKELTKYGIEKNYFVNFLGPFLLTFRLLGKLKESAEITRDSRIINVIGTPKKHWDVQLDDINFDKRRYYSQIAYNQSKLALAYFTILLDQHFKQEGTNISVYGTSPVYKRIFESLQNPVHFFAFIDLLRNFIKANPFSVTGPVIRCATDVNLKNVDSGCLFSYLNKSWGWGKIDQDLTRAKLVWNDANKRLLGLKDINDEVKEKRKNDVERPQKTPTN